MIVFRSLFLIFLIVPIIEIYLLIKVGSIIGALPTVFLVVFTAVLGAFLIRIQGFATLRRGQQALARGELPAVQMLEGMALVVAGVLLLTPGFFTDTVGFLLLIPQLRRALIRWVLGHGRFIQRPPRGPRGPQRPGGDRNVIEGEFRRDD